MSCPTHFHYGAGSWVGQGSALRQSGPTWDFFHLKPTSVSNYSREVWLVSLELPVVMSPDEEEPLTQWQQEVPRHDVGSHHL
jgi:hypothetical protein